jgi:hypothetical protein
LQEAGRPGVHVKFIVAERPADWAGVQPQVTLTPSSASSPAPSLPAAGSAASLNAPEQNAAKREKPGTPVKLSIEDFRNDPLIQKALEIFKGQIVEVRA